MLPSLVAFFLRFYRKIVAIIIFIFENSLVKTVTESVKFISSLFCGNSNSEELLLIKFYSYLLPTSSKFRYIFSFKSSIKTTFLNTSFLLENSCVFFVPFKFILVLFTIYFPVSKL